MKRATGCLSVLLVLLAGACFVLYKQTMPLTAAQQQLLRRGMQLNSQALQLQQYTGQYRAAIPLASESLEICRDLFGQENQNYATGLAVLATLYCATGEYTKWKSQFLQALDIQRRLLGKMHPDFAQSLNNLAVLYETTGKLAKNPIRPYQPAISRSCT